MCQTVLLCTQNQRAITKYSSLISTTKNLQLNRGPDNESEHNNRLRQLENRRVKRLPSRMETVNEICVADVHAPRAIENEYYEPVCEPLAPTSGP